MDAKMQKNLTEGETYCLHKHLLIDCDNEEKENGHCAEVERIYEDSSSLFPFGAICMIQYEDIAHKDRPSQFIYCDDTEIFEILERLDIKNGADFYYFTGDSKTADSLIVQVHGQGYTFKNENHCLEVKVTYKALSEDLMIELLFKYDRDGYIEQNMIESRYDKANQKINFGSDVKFY